MATTNTKTNDRTRTIVPDLEATTERVREVNERAIETGRKVTLAYLDSVERYWTGVTKAEHKFGDQARIDAFGQLLHLHADLTEDVVKAGVSASRDLVAS